MPSVNWHDVGGAWWQWEPAGKMMSRAFQQGHIPLWDSEVGGGVDSHVNMIQTQYYPPYVALLLAGDTPFLRDMYYLAELFISGLFCYLLLHGNGFHLLSSVAMGMVYMLGGAMIQNVNSSLGQSFAVLPMMVWATDLVLRRDTWKSVGAGSAVVALAASSCFLPAVISGYLLCGIYVAVEGAWWWGHREEGRAIGFARIVKASTALGLSILLLAFILVPVELASRQDQTFTTWYRGLGRQHFALIQMLALVSPSIGFDVNQSANPNAQLFTPPAMPSPFYVGLIPLLLASVAWGRIEPRFRKVRIYFGAATACLFLKLVGALPLQWIALLPVFRDVHFIPYFGGALGFGFAGLAGIGMEQLITGKRRSVTIGASVAVMGIFLWIVWFDEVERVNARLGSAALASAIAHYKDEIVRILLLGVTFLAVLALRGRYLRGYAGSALLLLLVLFDLGPLAKRDRFLRSDAWTNPPAFIRFLQADHGRFRVHGPSDVTVAADVSQAFGLDILSSRMAFNSSRYTDILRMYFNAPELPYPLARGVSSSGRTLLDILNVKYLLLFSPDAAQVQQLTASGFTPAFESGHYRIFANSRVWGRAYLADAWRVVRSPGQALAGLAGLRPGEALLEEQPRTEYSATGNAGGVDDIRYDFNHIFVRAHASTPGLLVLCENFSPGWRATVNGKPATIHRANYAFQAIGIPAGTADVRFTYAPPGLAAGLGMSLVAAAVIGGLCFARRET